MSPITDLTEYFYSMFGQLKKLVFFFGNSQQQLRKQQLLQFKPRQHIENVVNGNRK